MPPKRPAGTAVRLSAFETECVAFFADVVQVFGVPKSVGHIYGLLYASTEPIGFPEIVGRLGISKGSASQGLQLLRSLGALRAVPRSHNSVVQSRYEPELGLRRLIKGLMRERIAPLVTNAGSRMRLLREHAEACDDAKSREFTLGRVEQLETWRRQATLVMPLLRLLVESRKG